MGIRSEKPLTAEERLANFVEILRRSSKKPPGRWSRRGRGETPFDLRLM
jgi:hypothetical protein